MQESDQQWSTRDEWQENHLRCYWLIPFDGESCSPWFLNDDLTYKPSGILSQAPYDW